MCELHEDIIPLILDLIPVAKVRLLCTKYRDMFNSKFLSSPKPITIDEVESMMRNVGGMRAVILQECFINTTVAANAAQERSRLTTDGHVIIHGRDDGWTTQMLLDPSDNDRYKKIWTNTTESAVENLRARGFAACRRYNVFIILATRAQRLSVKLVESAIENEYKRQLSRLSEELSRHAHLLEG